MHHFFNRFDEFVNRLTYAEQRPDPIQLLNYMLRALVETVSATHMFLPGLTMKVLRANLLKVEQLSAKGVLEGHALVARGGGRPSVTCSYCGKANHSIEKCWKEAKDEKMAQAGGHEGEGGSGSGSSSRGSRDMSRTKCYRCPKFGHMAETCTTVVVAQTLVDSEANDCCLSVRPLIASTQKMP